MTAPNNNTPAAIIADAYFDAGLLQEGQSLNGEQFINGMRRLADLINLWQTQGLKLWLNVDTNVPLVASQGTYSLSVGGDVDMTRPLRALEAYYIDANSVRRPLTLLSWNTYSTLSQVTQTGQVSSCFVNKQATALSVSFWLVPDATAALGSVHLVLQTQVVNFINVLETMNFPNEWRIALRWGLADEIATGQPEAIMARCQQRSAAYRLMLEDWDVEDTPTRFTPDSRVQYYSGSFR